MESLFTYLWKSAAIVTLFYGFYRLLLHKETYFESIRYFLLFGIIACIVMPFMIIPNYIDTTKTQIAFENINNNYIIGSSEAPFDWITLLKYIYLGVASIFLIRLISQLVSILILIRKSEITKTDNFYFVETDIETSPFSFFNFIVFNPSQFNKNELNQILNHEKAHAIQKHSIDTLLSNLLTIILWFNPFAWFYKKDIEQNLEFIADGYAQESSESQQSYQQLLLKTSIPNYQMALANNFYNSLLKKRIIMLHKQRSNSKSQWKFALIAPLLLAFLFAFNTKTIAQQKKNKKKIVKMNIEVFVMGIDKTSTKSDLDEIVKTFSEKGLTVKFNGVKRNSNNEITAIKIDAKAKNDKASASYASNVEDGINPIQISFDKENNNLSVGSSSGHGIHEYSFTDKGHKKIIKRKGKGNNFVFFSDDDDDDDDDDKNVWITKKGNKKIIIHKNNDSEGVHEVIIDEDDDGKEVRKEVIKIRSKKGGGEEKFMFFSTDGEEEPLFILNGKEITKKEMEDIDSDSIESIDVLKGDKAIEKYGKKAKDGVVVITTKKK